MLGTISLIALFTMGFFHFSVIILIPFVIVNMFLGLHFPPGKAEMLQERGTYWSVAIGSAPLQAILAAVIYGIGYLCGYLLE